jgi:DNA-binding NarL/FixJ family response regulator
MIRILVGRRPRHRAAGVVVLTGSPDERVREAIDAGACGFLLEDADVDEALDAVRMAAAGHRPAPAPAVRGLSPREREVFDVLGGGRSNRQIADPMGISKRMVKAHLARAFQVVGVADRVPGALWSRRHLAPAGS